MVADAPQVWEKRIFPGQWVAANAGGCTNYPTWNVNPQYWLRVHAPTQMFFHLAARDMRSNGQPKYRDALGVYLFKVSIANLWGVSVFFFLKAGVSFRIASIGANSIAIATMRW